MGELFAAWRFVPARMRAGWRLLLVTGAGVLAAAALLAASPIYAGAMANLGLQFRLGNALAESRLNWVAVEGLRFDAPDLERRRAIDSIFEARLGWLGDEVLTAERSGRITLDVKPAEERALPSDPTDEGPDWAAFIYSLSALENLTRLTEGRYPANDRASPEVVLLDGFQPSVALNQRLELNLGGFDDCLRRPFSEDDEERADEVPCVPTTRLAQSTTVTVVGFVAPRDRDDPRWEVYGGSLDVPAEPAFVSLEGLTSNERNRALDGEGSMPLLTTPANLEAAFAPAMPLTPFTHRTGIVVDLSKVETDQVQRAIEAGADLQTDLSDRLDSAVLISLPAVRELDRFRNSLSFNQVPLFLVLLQVAGIVIYYVVIVSSTLIDQQAEEVGVFRSRGASAVQLTGLYLIEAVVVALPAAVAAPWLASRAIALLGLTPTFRSMTDGSTLPAEVSPPAILLAVAGALLGVIAMLLPALASTRQDIIDVKAAQARPPGRSVVQRYFLDVAAVLLAGVLLWQLGRRGSIFDPDAVGGWAGDPLLLATPFVVTLAAAAIVLRVYPPLLRWTVNALLLAPSTAVAMGLRRAARSPAAYARLMLLLIMAIAVGTFAASYAPTVDRSNEDRLRYEAGADFRSGIVTRSDVDPEAGVEAIRALDGVAGAALATRIGVQTLTGDAFPLLGLEAERASALLWFRDDFAREAPSTLLNRLTSAVDPAGGVLLPEDAVAVQMQVFSETGRSRSLVWGRFRDATGTYYNSRFGPADFEGWATMQSLMPDGATAPIAFTGILITDERAAGIRQEGGLHFDDVEALLPGDRRLLLDDFEGRFGWAMFGLLRADEGFALSEDRARSGRQSLRWDWRAGITEGNRLLAINPGNTPLAAVVSRGIAERLGAEPGTILPVHIEDRVIPLAIRGVADLFPTMNPDTGFIVVNRADLEAVTRLVDVPAGSRPDEVWVNFDAPEQRSAELVALLTSPQSPLPLTGRALDLAASLDIVRTDPTLRASGSGILVVAFTAVLLLAALGFIVTLVLGASSRTVEFAVLRAVGSSRLQILRAMLLEWGIVLVLGLVVGVVLGRQIAGVMLSFLNVTEDGARVLPPFVVLTDWRVLGAGVAALVMLVLGALGLAWAAAVRRADAAQLRITR